jgi:hypothetical protein
MTIYTAARGEVVGTPVRVTADTGDTAMLVLREVPSIDLGQSGELGVEYQVCLREPDLVRRALQQVRPGDRLVVLGTLTLRAVSGPLEDALSAARVSLDAVAVGLDLTSQ